MALQGPATEYLLKVMSYEFAEGKSDTKGLGVLVAKQ